MSVCVYIVWMSLPASVYALKCLPLSHRFTHCKISS